MTSPIQTSDILLVALNSRYHHTSFALRYLYANLDELQPRAQILEFLATESPRDVAEAILARKPKIVGISVYIWNATSARELVSILKRVSPETLIVLGGPEVSHETDSQSLCLTADFTIQGEADFLFRDFCRDYLLQGKLPQRKFISGELPDIKKIASPYSYYTDEDVRQRYIYVEASRGCPYKCEYCLSSLDKSVRSFDLDPFLADLDRLIQRGARQFKFLDRTFNLSPSVCIRILTFFLERMHHSLFLHFEMVPDRLPTELKDLIKQFPAGSLQFEIGIQTWNPEVAKIVSRRQDYTKVRENLRFLSQETRVHTHADLIAGLPGETIESFAHGFDQLSELAPDEIQVGILKRLRGTPIIRHDQEWQMVYQPEPPYTVLSTKTMDFGMLQKMTRFSKFWDLYANSGNFGNTANLLRATAAKREDHSLFWLFWEFTGFLNTRHSRGTGIALLNLVESAWIFLTENLRISPQEAGRALLDDYAGRTHREIPRFLKSVAQEIGFTPAPYPQALRQEGHAPDRQRKHLSAVHSAG